MIIKIILLLILLLIISLVIFNIYKKSKKEKFQSNSILVIMAYTDNIKSYSELSENINRKYCEKYKTKYRNI